MNVDARLLEILVCPACRATLTVDHTANELICNGCGLAYPVRDDIPVMLVDEARSPATAEPSASGDDSTTG
ncbi:MAG: Trm112 family protein [Actinomycetota bacterium]|nr:Trm112 family protein [Actinomycetota bacterium]